MATDVQSEDAKVPLLGIRHLQTFLFFLAIAISYATRVNLSLAIVAMTDENSQNFVRYTMAEKSLILSSFFWGYVITPIPAGHFARKFGGWTILFVGMLFNSVMALVMPASCFMDDWRLPATVRTIQGMSQGLVYPSTHTLLAKWAPKEERSLLSMLTYCGGQLGTVIMFAGSGYIASSSLGWPGIFYISGGIGIAWIILWLIWGSSSPSDHKSISATERAFIEKSISNLENDETNTKDRQTTPWLKIFKSAPFWGLLVTHFTYNYSFWTLLIQIPTYLKNVFKFDIMANALLTSLPYLAMLLLDFIFAGIDALITKNNCQSITGRRKFFNTLATWVPAIALIGLGYVDTNHTKLAVFLLVIAVGFGGAIYMGYMVNHIDLSPNFAGILMAITNTLANLTGIAAPLVVGFIVTDEENIYQWRIVFFIAAGLGFFGNLLFIICGSAKVQSFNEPGHVKNEQDKI